ncbi:MAG: NrfD/PsrC family molybdoenzyme membrane anchor subunit [Planctomycetota bacterium]
MSKSLKSFSLLKSILWAIMGVWAVVTVARFLNGLGATTGLNDSTPWGLWIAFDVMAGVALAAGGFVLAATVYIFGLEKYRPFVRSAILTAFLGYIAVAIGLLYDLGLPWHIWHPIVHPQHHSVLFEVAMCVMFYLAVLGLEFSPVVLEHPWFDRPLLRKIHAVVKRLVIPLVIAGIVLSTLHQSSLGSLFLIQPFRVHPLWYSPIVYVLFFISAIALGLMMVTLESLVSGWFFGHKIRTERLGGLGRAASVVLFLYAAIRLGDLLIQGKLGLAFDGSWQGSLFIFEMMVSAIVPAALLAVRRVRTSVAGLGACSILTVLGLIGYRFNICVVTFTRPDEMPYLPTWMELAVTAGVVAGGVLTFIFFVEHLKVYQDEPDDHAEPFITPSNDFVGIPEPYPAMVASPRRYSLIAVVTAALAVGFLPADAVFGPQPERQPVSSARMVDAVKVQLGGNPGRLYLLPGFDVPDTVPAGAPRTNVSLMLINGNRDARLVPFNHKGHAAELGGDTACVQCHHQNLPFDQNTSCSECHRDMYETTDTFDHALHIGSLGNNDACVKCHEEEPARKTRETAKACQACHKEMVVPGSRISPPARGSTGFAPGYMDAMHGLCIGCHTEVAKARDMPHHARCDTCHRPETERAEAHQLHHNLEENK